MVRAGRCAEKIQINALLLDADAGKECKASEMSQKETMGCVSRSWDSLLLLATGCAGGAGVVAVSGCWLVEREPGAPKNLSGSKWSTGDGWTIQVVKSSSAHRQPQLSLGGATPPPYFLLVQAFDYR